MSENQGLPIYIWKTSNFAHMLFLCMQFVYLSNSLWMHVSFLTYSWAVSESLTASDAWIFCLSLESPEFEMDSQPVIQMNTKQGVKTQLKLQYRSFLSFLSEKKNQHAGQGRNDKDIFERLETLYGHYLEG